MSCLFLILRQWMWWIWKGLEGTYSLYIFRVKQAISKKEETLNTLRQQKEVSCTNYSETTDSSLYFFFDRSFVIISHSRYVCYLVCRKESGPLGVSSTRAKEKTSFVKIFGESPRVLHFAGLPIKFLPEKLIIFFCLAFETGWHDESENRQARNGSAHTWWPLLISFGFQPRNFGQAFLLGQRSFKPCNGGISGRNDI